MKPRLPKRDQWAHKGDFGYVLAVGGSQQYSGSVILNALAALRSGTDLCMLIGHQRAMDAAAAYSPDLITHPFSGELSEKNTKTVLRAARKFDILMMGGGLPREKNTFKAIQAIIKGLNIPMVLDAEAIRALAEKKSIIKGKTAILTPHAEEFKILTGESLKSQLDDRKKKVKKWAKKLGVTILLKGHVDVISNGKEVFTNKTGSPFMTKAGTGDVLVGICAALLAQGFSPLEAAHAAAYVSGKAGEKAAKRLGAGLIASDLLEEIPEVLS